MWFSIVGEDVKDSLELRKQHRPAHLARLQQLADDKRLLVAGPNPLADGEGFSGSVVIAEFDDLDAAQQWADQDPYLLNGIYQQVTVKAFKPVLP